MHLTKVVGTFFTNLSKVFEEWQTEDTDEEMADAGGEEGQEAERKEDGSGAKRGSDAGPGPRPPRARPRNNGGPYHVAVPGDAPPPRAP